MLRAIISSIFSMSASSSGATEAKPALLTSMVMLGSSFSFASTRARSCLLLTSGRAGERCGERLEWRLAARYQHEIVSPLCETIRVDCADAARGAGDEGGAL